jgi:hypothetical protein
MSLTAGPGIGTADPARWRDRRLGFTTLETIRPLGSPPIELMIRNPG